MFVYKQTETDPALWTVGHYSSAGRWAPESDHGSQDEAARRAAWLNGTPTGGEGWLPPDDVRALRAALDQLIADAELCVLAMDDPRSYDATVAPLAAVAAVDLQRLRDMYLS